MNLWLSLQILDKGQYLTIEWDGVASGGVVQMMVIKSEALEEALPKVAIFLGLTEVPPSFSRTGCEWDENGCKHNENGNGRGACESRLEEHLRVREREKKNLGSGSNT